MPQEILGTLEEQIDPKHTALVVIDPQNDFCATDGAAAKLMGTDVTRIQSAIQPLNAFIKMAREAGLMIVWTQSLVDPNKARPSFKARSFMLDAKAKGIEIVREGGEGADWYTEVVKPLPDEYVITKYHYDAFEDTDLALLLGVRGIKTLLMTGFLTNVCVETTARHGYIKGYYIVVISDCTDTATEQEYDATLYNIKKFFGKVATSEEIKKVWG
jgi:ureidoacrylate peracid hydrolase